MDLFRTIVDVQESSKKIGYNTPCLWMGSCFTENIGSRLMELKLPCQVNPFGVLYNPESIRNSLLILAEKRLFTAGDLNYGNDLWYSFYHHSSYSHTDRDQCLEKINKSIENGASLLKNASFLFITFGTARAYRLREKDMVVSNNHKLPHSMFSQFLMTVDEITGSYKELIEMLKGLNPNLQIVFTLSPVRHWKDGATGNQVSKSTLMLAIAGLAESFDNVAYFPAYEIIMDELRDYRFYDEDMIHIGKQGVDYIWKRFSGSFISLSAMPVINEITGINQGIMHRPFNPSTEKHRKFLHGLLERIHAVERSVPAADFSQEKQKINIKLENYDRDESF